MTSTGCVDVDFPAAAGGERLERRQLAFQQRGRHVAMPARAGACRQQFPAAGEQHQLQAVDTGG